jgi:circadian clock protein KaiC
MGHSNQVREYRIGDRGIELIAPYIGPAGVMTGTARITQIARERAESVSRHQAVERRRRELQRRRATLERQIEELRATLSEEKREEAILLGELDQREAELVKDQAVMATMRGEEG